MRKYVFLLIFATVFLPQFSFAQELPKIPSTVDEGKTFGISMITQFPSAALKAWKEQAMFVFRTMWGMSQNLLKTAWKELEKRKPNIKKEFQEEKEEIKADIPDTLDTGRSLWERFKELLE